MSHILVSIDGNVLGNFRSKKKEKKILLRAFVLTSHTYMQLSILCPNGKEFKLAFVNDASLGALDFHRTTIHFFVIILLSEKRY